MSDRWSAKLDQHHSDFLSRAQDVSTTHLITDIDFVTSIGYGQKIRPGLLMLSAEQLETFRNILMTPTLLTHVDKFTIPPSQLLHNKFQEPLLALCQRANQGRGIQHLIMRGEPCDPHFHLWLLKLVTPHPDPMSPQPNQTMTATLDQLMPSALSSLSSNYAADLVCGVQHLTVSPWTLPLPMLREFHVGLRRVARDHGLARVTWDELNESGNHSSEYRSLWNDIRTWLGEGHVPSEQFTDELDLKVGSGSGSALTVWVDGSLCLTSLPCLHTVYIRGADGNLTSERMNSLTILSRYRDEMAALQPDMLTHTQQCYDLYYETPEQRRARQALAREKYEREQREREEAERIAPPKPFSFPTRAEILARFQEMRVDMDSDDDEDSSMNIALKRALAEVDRREQLTPEERAAELEQHQQQQQQLRQRRQQRQAEWLKRDQERL